MHQVVRHRNVHRRDARDVDDHYFCAVGADSAQQLFGQLSRPLRVDHPDDRENQQAFANLQNRSRQFPDGFLLLTDDALAFLDETDGHGVGDAVGRRFVGVQDAVQLLEIGLILCEKRARQHVAEEENNTDNFMRFDAARNDALGKISCVSLQRFEGFRLESLDVAVVHRRGFGEDFFLGHSRQQPGFRNAANPLFAELRSVLAEVCHQFAKQL